MPCMIMQKKIIFIFSSNDQDRRDFVTVLLCQVSSNRLKGEGINSLIFTIVGLV